MSPHRPRRHVPEVWIDYALLAAFAAVVTLINAFLMWRIATATV